jgi:hypothetical protein
MVDIELCAVSADCACCFKKKSPLVSVIKHMYSCYCYLFSHPPKSFFFLVGELSELFVSK